MTNIKLAVDVIGAHNLMPKDGEGSSSPFVEIYFEGQRFRTTIKEKDLNPVWNESFYINISDPSNLHCLTFHVSIYHHAKGTHSRAFLGKVSLTGTSIVRYSDAVVLHYPLEKRGIFSRIRGELALKVYTTDDQSLKFSIPLPAVESIPNHEASVNHGATTVMNTIPRTVSHDKSETRDTFHHLPNPSHNLQRDHSSAPTVSQHATKYGVDETKPESQPPQLVLMYSVSSSQLVYELKELSQVASVNQGATKQWVSRTFYSNNISVNQGAIPTVMNAIPSTVAHDSSETSPTFHHLPNPGHHQHHSSAPAVSHHATTYGVDEMNPEPQPPQLVRMYSASSPQPVDVSLKETSPFLESRQVVGGSGIRAATFLLQAWHQASSMVKSLLIFTFMGFHEILLPLFAWFWQLLFRVFFFQLQWVCHENKEFPNMIRLKLTIDKERNRVLYAESNKDFVDVLLSFLTLPMGTIIRLAEKRSGIGCMDNLYESVETLDDKFLQTKACRTMLLKPKNACEVLCNKLVVKIDDIDPAKHYICSKSFCSTQVLINAYSRPSFRLASAVKDSECICGGVMDREVFLEYLQEGMSDGNGVFVKETQSFVITDDLCITPTSMSDCLEMVRNLGVGNSERIEEMVVTISEEEVLQLLKNSFLSKTPLTNTFLMREQVIDDHDVPLFIDPVNPHEILTKPIIPSKRFAKMKVKLLIDKASNRVLCLEAEEDFLDIVLSFVTFPLGYMLKILRGHYCSLGSMDSLYKSVRKLDVKYLNSSKYREMLINPSLAPHFSCENQVLMIGEEMPTRFTGYNRCNNDSLCLSSWYKKLCLMNPKLPGQVTRGGGFVKKQSSLLIYDDLVIRPCSPTSGILDLLRNNVRVSDTQIQEVEVGGEEVMALLVASLTSKSVLNSVFCPTN